MLLTLPEMDDQFSRAKELHTIASEVLLVAEKLDTYNVLRCPGCPAAGDSCVSAIIDRLMSLLLGT